MKFKQFTKNETNSSSFAKYLHWIYIIRKIPIKNTDGSHWKLKVKLFQKLWNETIQFKYTKLYQF